MSKRKGDLLAFLKRHRLDRHAGVLSETGVDLDSLGLLTEGDLKELGLPVGDRRKLLFAASKLPGPAIGYLQSDFEGLLAERRHLTILFCDMVGSTALSKRLDPEDFADVIRAYTLRTKAAIERFGGHVAKVMGDGVLALFGYPSAHEDDVERAVLAALDCLKANRNAPIRTETGDRIEVQVRIGLHSGLAVVGALDAGTRSNDIVGDAPNIAQLLQSVAAPGEILVSPQIQKLAGERFEYEALEPRILKGIPELITPYRVRREIKTKTRFELRNRRSLAPLIGRSDELERLLDCWARTKAGSGQAILIAGPAGIGKSRLSSAFLDAIRTESKDVLTFQCSPHHTGTPLRPVVTRLTRELEALVATGEPSLLDAASAWLGPKEDPDAKGLALLTALLSIDAAERAVTLDMTPRQQMEETLLLLVSHSIAMAQQRPLLLLFEDMHWADPTTLRLVDLYRKKLTGESVMLIATSRSGAEHGPPPLDLPLEIRLDRLPDPVVMDLVRNVAHPYEIPPETVRTIARRGEGVPLFIEELTKSVVERLISREFESEEATKDDHLVPDSLVDSLSARLDALPSAKHLAQIAAAIGHEVPQDLLQRVSGYAPDRFQAAVSELAQARVIRSFPETKDDPLVFGHALIQDVAYQLLLRKDRRDIHAKIVGALERDYKETCNQLPEVLARHCEECRRIEKAVRYLIDAGVKATHRSANIEALKHLQHARDLTRGKMNMATPEALALELEIESAIGTPLISVEGYTSRETIRAFERAEEISVELGDDQARFRALFGLWGHRWMAGYLDLSQRFAEEMLSLSENDSAPERRILAHRCAGSSCWIMGEFERTRYHFGQVKALTQDMDTRELADRFAVCPRVVAHVLGGYAMWLEGSKEEGASEVAVGLVRAYDMKHPYSMALSHSMAGGLKLLTADFEGLIEHTEALRAISKDRRFPFWLAYAEIFEGAALAEKGKFDEGRDKILKSIEAYNAMGVMIHRTMQLVQLSDIEVRKGNIRSATRWLDEAEAVGNQTGERQWFGLIRQRRARIDTRTQALGPSNQSVH
ncbi:adenylate cyclase [Mesorhizobium sp. L-8-10]|uniref:AAA family ATPase n=1 Tax=Mesorhizobium sp. L-8-10 TaxID=2744523 RepID=UPI001927B447|nr:adenylate/guanylate cyclase domain-containing protein [Mesorhizobium sp. L-8-10]BCH30336.1 adenylate cyclase [Mesorhizobium sp. L-8-10]